MSETATIKNTVNGVDLTRLVDTINAVKETPTLAKFKFRAQNQWSTCGHNQSTIQGFYGVGEEDKTRTAPFVMDADEPDVLLGSDKGANPVEYVLHALAACMTTSIAYHAAARGIKIESIESELEGDLDLHGFLGLDENVRPGYQDIRVNFKIKADAAAEDLAELIKFSPVFNTVSQPVSIQPSIEMVK